MNSTQRTRKDVYAFLYDMRVENPKKYYSISEIEGFAEGNVQSALTFGLEFSHIERYRKHYRLTAQGMFFAENNAYVE